MLIQRLYILWGKIFNKLKDMKIVGEYIVLSKYGSFFKVALLENGLYIRYLPVEGYEEIGKEYFEECKERMS
jgi:hypothetical protein